MKPAAAALIFFTSVLGALLVLLSVAIYFDSAFTEPHERLNRASTSILDVFSWMVGLPMFQRFSVFAFIFLILLFITFDTIFVIWFIFYVQISKKPIEFIQSSYKNLERVDDIENLTPFGSIYSKNSTLRNPRACGGNINSTGLSQQSKRKSLSIPSVYFSQETPLRDSLRNSLANVRISTKFNSDASSSAEIDDNSSAADSMKDLYFDGKPIEFRMFHGKEVLV